MHLVPLIYDDSDDSGAKNNGLLQFCARIKYSVGDELVSYIDSKLVLDVSIAADIEFTQEVDISSDQTVNTVNQDVSTVIDVDSFLYGDPEENGGTPYAEEYSLGQAFRVCVDVKAADEDKFRLTNFGEVKCSTDSGLESIIISLVDDVATAASILTTLFDNEATAGAKSVDAQNEASSSAISFSTVLTNAYFTGGDKTLTCVGSVDVESMAVEITRGRQLVSFTVQNLAASSSSSRRRMEEETGAVAGAANFGATIKLSSSSSSSSVTASGSFPLWTTTTTLVIALVVGWSL